MCRMVGGASSSGSSVVHSAAPTPASAAKVSSTCQVGSWNSTVSGRSGGQAARSAARRSSFRLTPSGTRKRTVPRRLPNARYGVVSHGTLADRIDLERAKRAAALGLHREAEVVGRGGDPAGNRARGRAAVEGVVQLDRAQPRRVVLEQPCRRQPFRVEARRPAGVGEPARPDAQPAGHVGFSSRRSSPPPPRPSGRPSTRSAR